MDWTVVAPKLTAALEVAGGTHTLEDVFAAVERGNMQMHQGARSVIITEIVKYPRLSAVRVFVGAGELSELLAMMPKLISWAKELGCDRIETFGRIGWLKTLKSPDAEARVFMWRNV